MYRIQESDEGFQAQMLWNDYWTTLDSNGYWSVTGPPVNGYYYIQACWLSTRQDAEIAIIKAREINGEHLINILLEETSEGG